MRNTKKIKLILFALCFGASFILFGSNSKVNAHITLQVKNTAILNVRAAENSDANTEILGVLYKGDTINVDYVNKETGWVKLSSTNFIRESATSENYIKLSKVGYCKLSYLKMPSKNILCKTKEPVVVYQEASDTTSNSSKKIAKIKKGKQVKVVKTTKYWAKLSIGGYCLKTELKKYSGATKYVYNTPLLNVRTSPYILDTNKKGELTPVSKVSVVETLTTKDKNGNEYKWSRLKNGTYCCSDYLTSSYTDAIIYSEILADAQSSAYYNNSNSNNDTNNSSQIKIESTPHFTTSTTSLYKYNSTTNSYEPCKDRAQLDSFTIIDVIDWREGWYEILGGYYIQDKDVALYFTNINAYLATSSPKKGQLVLYCDNGQKLTFECTGGTQGFPTPLGTTFGDMPDVFWPGYVEIENSLEEKILQFTHKDCKIYITREAL